MKPFFAIANGIVLNNFHNRFEMKFFLSIILSLIPIILIAIEPNISTAIIYTMTWFAQLFIAHIGWYIIFILSIIMIGFSSIAYLVLPYVRYRIALFFESNGESGYQINKAFQSISEGGWLGKGLGEGIVKYNLPDAHCDYVFAAIIEECGVIFGIFLITLYAYIILRFLLKIQFDHNDARRIGCMGIIYIIFLQIFINIGVSINLIPSTGVTLPFISYGGSSMISMAISFGILFACTKRGLVYHSPYDKIRFKSI